MSFGEPDLDLAKNDLTNKVNYVIKERFTVYNDNLLRFTGASYAFDVYGMNDVFPLPVPFANVERLPPKI